MSSTGAFDPNVFYGALLIGLVLSAVLFGVSTVQVYIYHGRFPDDRVRLKALVAFLWLMEGAHLGMITNLAYTWMVTDFGQPELMLGRIPRSLSGTIIVTSVISVTVQGFFSYRIYALSRSWLATVFSYSITLVRLGLGTSIFALSLTAPSLAAFNAQYQWLLITLWSLTAAGDITITLALVYLLWRQRSKVMSHTTQLLDKVIKWTVETGVTTSLFTTLMLICFHTMPDNLVWMAFFFIEARLFVNSLLAALNSRTVLRELHQQSGSGNQSATQDGGANLNGAVGMLSFKRQSPTTAISVDVHSHLDLDDSDGNWSRSGSNLKGAVTW
ncbi:hypothetical protein HMN09_01105400 [Mycena chlorophos]|uniref:DUF6534 domain-containing protein n=1 Tax=Mycena chlorophos TaxID=658473 RepID=A0A8H6SBG7_MYCCL|nr:hypothetical protein HMN09_01105400 [Mycena chlorophos]